MNGQFIFTQPRGSVLAEIGKRIDAGHLIPLPVSLVRPLADIVEIHAMAETGNLHGKTVFRIADA